MVVVGAFFDTARINVTQKSFRDSFPKLLIENSLNEVSAKKITDKTIDSYSKRDSVFYIMAIMGIVMIFILFFTYWTDYRRRYPKSLTIE